MVNLFHVNLIFWEWSGTMQYQTIRGQPFTILGWGIFFLIDYYIYNCCYAFLYFVSIFAVQKNNCTFVNNSVAYIQWRVMDSCVLSCRIFKFILSYARLFIYSFRLLPGRAGQLYPCLTSSCMHHEWV